MADELNIPTHRWYQRQNNVQFAKQDMSKQWIYASGISRLLSSTAIYAANGFNPEMVLDFAGETYFVDSATTTFDSAITHAATTNATMVDSDGLLKWRPHNLIRYSEDLANAAWTKTDVTVSGSTFTAAVGTTIFPRTSLATVGTTADNIWHTITVNATEGTYAYLQITTGSSPEYATFDLSTASVGAVHPSATASIAAKGDGSYDCTLNLLVTGTNDRPVIVMAASAAAARYAAWSPAGTETFDVNHVEYYRSDLGGMVNNPDRGDSYVPTTTAARYLPRRGHHVYNGSEWVNEGLLHESDARTNLVLYSDDLTNAEWTNASGLQTITGTSPFDLIETAVTDAFIVLQSYSVVSGENYCLWAVVEANGRNFARINPSANITGPSSYAEFDLVNGTVTNAGGSNVNEGIVGVGSGKWLVYITVVATGTGNSNFNIGPSDDGLNGISDYAGTDGLGIKVYRTQAELGSTPSSYIPTAGATATRAAETLTVPAANMPYDSTSMSIQMQGRMTYADEDIAAQIELMRWFADGSNNVRLYLSTNSFREGRMDFVQEALNVTDNVVTSDSYFSPDINVPFNIASRHGSTFINGAVDGTALTANTTPTALPDLSATDFQLGYDYMGTIGKLRVWADDIGDTGIAEASA